ncbi:uncharacterized protein ARMOST_07553 [Armillaria ostoyae]|uniref:Uncharacterized protein n=1 Tax=Armillaria ostoyae TaxID=47428 RepID=A0A284R648_ARMOS|nr:uncharacterized protein ARMOST_07549 [Armillaria ostoyae]SJL04193.1 uncharacterized protein ARMOST_07553 [Armillaria ostoyae]
MSTLFIVIAQSELVHWDASALAEVRACLIGLQSTLRRVLGARNGIVAVRYIHHTSSPLSDWIVLGRSLQNHGRNPHKSLKLYGMDRILLGSIHFAQSHRRDAWLPCQSIEVSLNCFRLALGHRLSARVYYNQDDHVDFNDEL